MGFLEWLFGKDKDEGKKEAITPTPQSSVEGIDINEAMKTTETKEEETVKRYVKVTNLDSKDKVDKIGRELLAGNIMIVDVGEISKESTDKSSLQTILKELKNKAEEVHGEIARLSEERLILIPSDMKFVRVAGKEE